MGRSISRIALIIAVCAGPSVVAGQGALRLTVQSDQRRYVVHEPVQLTITLANVSSGSIRVPQVSRFNMDEMEFIFFEVTDPNGTIRRTKSVRSHVYKVMNVEYPGMPLAPGDSIQFFYYPSLTNISVGETGEKVGPVRDLFTFPNVGAYRLRVVYYTQLEYQRLYGAGGGPNSWRSNEVTLTFRQADETERVILDTLWRCDPAGEGGSGLRRVDLPALKRMIDQYPTHVLTRHACYAYGRLLIAKSIAEDRLAASEAATVLADLVARAPAFRHDAVHLFLARSYRYLGQNEQAAEVLTNLMAQRPILWTNWPFVVEAAYLTPEPQQSIAAWQAVEMHAGPKAVPTKELYGVWTER